MNIVSFIADKNPQSAQQIKNEVATKALQLLFFPDMGRTGQVKGMRELVINHHYVIIYVQLKSNIIMLRVLHTPQQWPPISVI
ncbi:type II toxin-antitoxin system RelE/ParE family toxin [Providencia manganoxydans]|uniref:Type II toxin-antitoxin system RelE/ParE family toxin n=1 Tax=Providencia manganoxydans TaxID=2923283 RepID=A0ABX7ABL4_9GAMM|nr:type II toxin-antitoxin system RelE/ParE family toxin [Providencia manganoxydans]MDX4944164.1 type II toxin-antitoxin system RelE/ParE family toxin [Providencia manganoxydans]QQO60869.1 type II toxin-antitoxin system RelE/ParE family toxin [Providencia manganoxydans]HEF8772640.1 type II toxin-antitoxin system RelE/ParE family toxin [Providencia stuartii]